VVWRQLGLPAADAGEGNTGVWITFIAVVVLYTIVGVTTILVLRGMSRRFRQAEGPADHEVPYGPSAPPAVPAPADEEPVR
jgi:cytochrome d ubiquinol oxidase subunit I